MDSGSSQQAAQSEELDHRKSQDGWMNKKDLSERDICSKFIGPAIKRAGWDGMLQIRQEVAFTKGRIIVRGKLVSRGKAKRADYILYYKPNIPIAIVEAKDNNHSVGDGMQQALDYAATLTIPFVFSSNGDAFVFHDRTGQSPQKEANLTLDQFPSPAELWEKYRAWKGLTPDEEKIVLQDYFDDASGKAPRYYQCNAVNGAMHSSKHRPYQAIKRLQGAVLRFSQDPQFEAAGSVRLCASGVPHQGSRPQRLGVLD